jgi:RNA polymerase sigma factor for flagellar operon FliA
MRRAPARAVAVAEPSAGALGAPGLWQLYWAGRTEAERNALAVHYAEFARMLAAKAYARRVVEDLEFDDFHQYARIGLLEAVERFRPDGGAKFETYAALRINGAMLNGLARASELQEQLAARKRVLEERTGSLNEAPEDDVFARLARLAVGLAVGMMLEGSGMFRPGDERVDTSDAPYASLALAQLCARVRAAVTQLPLRQRQVVEGHYLQHEAFDDIARRLALSKGRVSQLHREALTGLRAALQRHAILNVEG